MVRLSLSLVVLVGCASGTGLNRRGPEQPGSDAAEGDASVSVLGDAAPPRDAGSPPTWQDAGPLPPTCTQGETHACTSACGTIGITVCQGGAFGACTPPGEMCNAQDDDCDGARDEDFECVPGASEGCTTSCGSAGTHACGGGCAWETCVPPGETCNGRDDDCNGAVDDGSLCGPLETCRGSCVRTLWVFEAEDPSLGHGVGRADAEGWSASTQIDGAGTLVYGPYTSELPPGWYDVAYRLMIDNPSGTDVVARVDINDFDAGAGACGTCVIATRDVRRYEFAAGYAYQELVIRFYNPGGHRLEFRTYWTDRAYVRQDGVSVRAL